MVQLLLSLSETYSTKASASRNSYSYLSPKAPMAVLSPRNCMPLRFPHGFSSPSRRSFFGTWVHESSFRTRSKNRPLEIKAYIHLQNGTPRTDIPCTEQRKTPAEGGCTILKTDKADSTLNRCCLHQHFTILGYARTPMTDHELRNLISENLTCRVVERDNCDDKMAEFLKCCFYHSEREAGRISNRLFYLAIPSSLYVDVARCTKHCASSKYGWTRLIVEKPFGHDNTLQRTKYSGLTTI
ncbi:hypothetical protein K1719_019986 [Acacia pycnantha]|nr:hypothetical protein K1719_019986 [Acacia pycnantha]